MKKKVHLRLGGLPTIWLALRLGIAGCGSNDSPASDAVADDASDAKTTQDLPDPPPDGALVDADGASDGKPTDTGTNDSAVDAGS